MKKLIFVLLTVKAIGVPIALTKIHKYHNLLILFNNRNG